MENFPTLEDLKKYIEENGKSVSKRAIARAFNVTGHDRITLKKMLRQLEDDNVVTRTKSKSYTTADTLADVVVAEITGISVDGEITATPTKWDGDKKPPVIYVHQKKNIREIPDTGSRVLVRLDRVSHAEYNGHVIKYISKEMQLKIVGIVKTHADNSATLYPANKKERDNFFIPKSDIGDAKDGDLVVVEIQPHGKRNRKEARVVEVLGHEGDPRLISLIAIYDHDIPCEFPEQVINDAKNATVPELGNREDLRDVPLITIDGADARDFDDAVYARPDTDPDNPDGFYLVVAIADVSFYVRPNTPLDKEAYKRGNSTYFPDRVVPMLPEGLSNDLCSLRPNEIRACMVAHLWINRAGELIRYRFTRGLMSSIARTTYEQVQAARDGVTDTITEPLMKNNIIPPLYDAFHCLEKARKKRGALELDLPERQVKIDKTGQVTGITPRSRLNSHKLIEEFMILANVAAAKAIESKNLPCVYRVHDKPNSMKLDDAREFLSDLGYSIPKGSSPTPFQMNQILQKSAGTDYSQLISILILRSQSQAVYSSDNLGHFGLGLGHYTHFTSPIRRYADLMVHRLLTQGYDLGVGQYKPEDLSQIDTVCETISDTERRSMKAERSSMDRFIAQYLSEKVGLEFSGRINGVSRFGLFITLDESGADGIVPIRTLPRDYYIHDETQHALIGKNSGRIYRLCAPVTVRLLEANAIKGSTVLELTDNKGAELPGFKPRKSHKPRPSKHRDEKSTSEKRQRRPKNKKTTTPKHKRKSKHKTQRDKGEKT